MPETLDTFGDDEGTLWCDPGASGIRLSDLRNAKCWKWALRRRIRGRPLIWFVDDEKKNRDSFQRDHCPHFAVITFSSRRHVVRAMSAGTPCDAVVTDIFFPAQPVTDDQQASRLLQIYDDIQASTVASLPDLWSRAKVDWSLDGFDIARDITRHAQTREERIPVLLFSRKATLLLNREDLLDQPSTVVENTFWLLEKIDPGLQGEAVRRVASIQRDRITAALRYRQASAAWWQRVLGLFRVRLGPLTFQLTRQGGNYPGEA